MVSFWSDSYQDKRAELFIEHQQILKAIVQLKDESYGFNERPKFVGQVGPDIDVCSRRHSNL